MIEERYLCATSATNLLDVPHCVGQVDLIKASGLSERNMAAHYLRLISKPTREDVTRVYAALLCVVQRRKLDGGADSIVAAMEWLVNPRCNVCHGAGLIAKKGKDHKCPKCKGEKLRREPQCKTAQILIDYVQTCRHAHSGRMFAKLR